jgi:hypothetical protein
MDFNNLEIKEVESIEWFENMQFYSIIINFYYIRDNFYLLECYELDLYIYGISEEKYWLLTFIRLILWS